MMLTDQELQSLRNLGNQCEEAASEIYSLRAALTQKRAEYEDLKQTMHNMARNHALQLEAARKHEPESVPELRAKATELHGEILAEVYRLHADAEFGARWRQDSSLATWFPITAEKLKPLTDKQIAELVGDYCKHADQHDMSPHSIVRAIEAAHGIGA